MIIVDDHLALLALSGRILELDVDGPVVTTWGFQFRMARALMDSVRSGTLSRRATDPSALLRRILRPPANRLIVLDPRASAEESVRIAVEHKANLLLAELGGAAVFHSAAVRVSSKNVGRSWAGVMRAESVDFSAVEPG